MATEMVECGECNGTGQMDCPMEWGGDCPEECPACDGEQKCTCTICFGTGEIEEVV